MTRSVFAEIDTHALRHNIAVIRYALSNSKTQILFMIKANAYGHGLSVLLPFIDGVDAVGVATVSAAVQLRQQGFSRRIVLMPGFHDSEDLLSCVQHNVTPVVHSGYQIDLLEQWEGSRTIDCWFKVDTGMSRLGFSLTTASAQLQRLRACSVVNEDALVIMSHLATADDETDPLSQVQIERFKAFTHGRDFKKSLCNSAAIFRFKHCHYDWVRPGISLYGVSPLVGVSACELGLRPVMTLKARIIAIRHLSKGDCIGYGGVYQCARPIRVAVVNIGYGDGYPRNAPHGTPVLIHGVRCPIVGRVSMDMLTVDITAIADTTVGDEVILWGGGLPVEEVAGCIGDLTYEMLAQVTSRVEFKIVTDKVAISS